MRLAIPSDAPGGLDAVISLHFGHCDVFTLVDLDGEEIVDIQVVENGGHEHGGCLTPVGVLEAHGVAALLAGGMGGGPLAGFGRAGIRVWHKAHADTVREVIQLYLQGVLSPLGEEHACGGGGGGGCGGGGCGGHGHDHGHHHHAPVERPPIEGEPRVQADRVVTIEYTLHDADGQLLGSSRQGGPLTYLHGHRQMVPGFERAVEGCLPGEHVTVQVEPEEGYGVHDPAAVFEVSRAQIPGEVALGQVVHARTQDGGVMQLTVVEATDYAVRLDGNHPLAGKTLLFEVEIMAVEAATPEELAHGHAH